MAGRAAGRAVVRAVVRAAGAPAVVRTAAAPVAPGVVPAEALAVPVVAVRGVDLVATEEVPAAAGAALAAADQAAVPVAVPVVVARVAAATDAAVHLGSLPPSLGVRCIEQLNAPNASAALRSESAPTNAALEGN